MISLNNNRERDHSKFGKGEEVFTSLTDWVRRRKRGVR